MDNIIMRRRLKLREAEHLYKQRRKLIEAAKNAEYTQRGLYINQ